ncbi:curli assembly protein CsgF [Pseudomonas oryzihabitans]|uniref:Curli production assembly/transport component CsgF n=1 Tax=Pseudomonas oryzihabitans TaxID=47885 RepID=A0AAJ2BKJ9_9PSED|nr:curli assembly protein CsgF [Pseudomonas psychrotolerans]KTT26991.1 curli production assembly protein CsgF [Pseudomonas psychrotolerans]KTT52222.1 curli production assembly protein CsgF [Pseudomonas psychrotolerans]KTT58397.1 curli production assembly protein CsgF [Pseudomonas psychrotolerans]MDR6234287.1 curli production assembly/transport component CsgF [Pseudomonas psychrotolerans]MDR6356595.1 curli production assembly/transport component CsgF [Pseudomonas psychrotolerans]
MKAHAWRALPLAWMLGTLPAWATELVYTPVNPSFGGNPLNGTYLLNNATAQDRHKDPDLRSSSSSQSALERFTSQLESRLLSQVLTDIKDGNSGSLSTDQFIVNIIDDSGNLTVQITDRGTGEISEISVNGFNQP